MTVRAAPPTTTCALALSLWACQITGLVHAQHRPLRPDTGITRLATAHPNDLPTIQLSPRIRSTAWNASALPTLPMRSIEAFLSQSLILERHALEQAPRIVGGEDARTMLAQGDRAYARGPSSAPLRMEAHTPRTYLLYRPATPIPDPASGAILGYEARYLGWATLQHGEMPLPPPDHAPPTPLAPTTDHYPPAPIDTPSLATHLPATLWLQQVQEEIRAGDRLLPRPERQPLHLVPHVPRVPITAHVASLYSNSGQRYASQYQVIAINKGRNDGVTPGLVLSLVSSGTTRVDASAHPQTTIQLPDAENGWAIVFHCFDRLSYALILDAQRVVRVGDRLTSPR